MKTSSSLNSLATLAALAGLAASSLATPPALQLLDPDRLVPTRTAGVLYVNLQTGERTLTRYGITEIPEISTTHATAAEGLFDYWMSVDVNPCWDDPRADGFAFQIDDDYADSFEDTHTVAFDFGDLPFDSKITGIVLKTVVLTAEDTDSNADGVLDSGIDTVAIYYDALSESNRTSIAPPTAAVRVESVPGAQDLTTQPYESYDIVVDFAGQHFELGDSDGLNRGSMWLPGAAAGLDVEGSYPNYNQDGLADFQYLQHYTKHGWNGRAWEDAYIALGAPDGTTEKTTYTISNVVVTTYTTSISNATVTSTYTTTRTVVIPYLIPDPLPQAHGAQIGVGFGLMRSYGEMGFVDWFNHWLGGCCYWFGGINCEGFLEQLELDPPYNPTWYNFRPYAQFYHGLFSDAPPQTQCGSINFAEDTVLDNSDIYAFIQLFLTQDPIADLNHDTFLDNADIGVFINLFLTCTG